MRTDAAVLALSVLLVVGSVSVLSFTQGPDIPAEIMPGQDATTTTTATSAITTTTIATTTTTTTTTAGEATDLDLREANVVDVTFEAGEEAGVYDFSVTLYHDDDGEAGFANWWQVETLNGTELGRRTLLHAHTQQPFTRSERIEVPENVSLVVVRGHDQTHDYGGQAMVVDLRTGATQQVQQGPERRDFGECSVVQNETRMTNESNTTTETKTTTETTTTETKTTENATATASTAMTTTAETTSADLVACPWADRQTPTNGTPSEARPVSQLAD